MPRRALVTVTVPALIALLAAGAAPLVAADAAPNALDAPAGAGATAISATVQVNRANVRFGPGQTAKLACTLNHGDTVEIIGTAQVPDWYVVRFPTQGRAWVSEKVMTAIDGGKRWKVTVDGAHARADATMGAEIVCDLAAGEVLEDRGAVQGDFHAVYIPTAVAYVRKDLLSIPDAAAVSAQVQHAGEIDALWQQASAEYIRDYQQLQADPKAASSIAWDGLLKNLEQVADEDSDAVVAQKARRCHDGIEHLIAASANPGLPPPVNAPAPANPPPANPPANQPANPPANPGPVATANPPAPVNPADYPVPAGQPGATPAPLQVPQPAPVTAPTPDEVAKTPAPAAPADSGPHAAEGYVIANSDYPKVNAPFLLQDGNSNVIAFLTIKDGAQVNLQEYLWRSVGVDGDKQALDAAALGNLPAGTPLISVSSVSMLGK
jgi:uncharacterized protein YgiM (DUF1202 family)